ncbi:MAG: DUF3572 domain-containing protein [Bauldia litoralis]
MHRRDSSKPAKILDREAAEAVAVAALSFLVSRPEDLSRFFALTGLAIDTIRQTATEPGFLGGVLDFYLGDDRLLTDFAADAGMPPENVAVARHMLDPHGWQA